MNYINLIGLEIECGVDRDRDDIAEEVGVAVTGDGSIRTEFHEAEFLTHPSADLEEICETVSAIYDNIVDINESMGLHVHVSFNKLIYAHCLCSKRFYDYFIERLKETEIYEKYKSVIDSRLEGDNSNVRRPRAATFTAQLISPVNDRRHFHINFTNLKNNMRTVEFRVFPAMNTAEDVRETVVFLIKTIQEYLKHEKRERRFISHASTAEIDNTYEVIV